MKLRYLALGLVVTSCNSDGTAPGLPDLTALPTPDGNTAAVMLASDLRDGSITLPGRELMYYDLVPGSTPHSLTYNHRDSDSGHFLVVVSELYRLGVVTTNGINNLVVWTSPGGTEYRPSTSCRVDVVQPFVFGLDSEMIVETVCDVRSPGGRTVTILARASRLQTGLTGS